MSRYLGPIVGIVLAACSSGTAGPGLTVGAASSLTEVMNAIGDAYDRAEITVSAAGSQVLAAQVREGAPLDVVITADRATIERLASSGLLRGSPARIAGNRLVIVVAGGNPREIASLTDLGRDDLTVVLAAPEVPAGNYAAQALATAGIALTPASLEPSVRSVVAKVRLGEADAGLVYATDITDDVDAIELPPDVAVATSYFAAVVATTGNAVEAERFVEFLNGERGQAVLRARGFAP